MPRSHEHSEILTPEDIASAINSILRISATFIIYLFHCNAQYGFASNNSLFYAFSFFLFISGYYSIIRIESPNKWLFNRLKRIYIPYWIIIIGVIIANMIFQHKDVSIKELFFIIIGGNLFIEHKLYVILWFISVILSLYIYVYLATIFQNWTTKIIVTVLTITFLLHFNIPFYFFTSFGLGYLLHWLLTLNGFDSKQLIISKKAFQLFKTTTRPLFIVQNYSYEFFLVHGGVLLFFTKVLHSRYQITLYGGIMTTIACTIFLKTTTQRINSFLFSKF